MTDSSVDYMYGSFMCHLREYISSQLKDRLLFKKYGWCRLHVVHMQTIVVYIHVHVNSIINIPKCIFPR